MRDPETLSEKSFLDNYAEKGFTTLWIKSYGSAKQIIIHILFLLCSVASAFFVPVSIPYSYRQFMGLVSEVMLTYSSTIIGFLLVSFSILLSLSNVRNTFSYFVKHNQIYKKPLLKVILDHFIFPIGIFLILLVGSLIVKLVLGIADFSAITLQYKEILYRIFVCIYSFLFLLSVSELVSYFFNMYRFIVITSLTVSKEYEEEILHKIYVLGEKIDVLKVDDAKVIVDYQEKKKET